MKYLRVSLDRENLSEPSEGTYRHWALISAKLWIKGCVHTWCPSTVPENESWWALMWTDTFFQCPRQNSGTVPVPESLDLVLRHWTGHQHIGYLVSEHSTILCRCQGTSARAPSVNTVIDKESHWKHQYLNFSIHTIQPKHSCNKERNAAS